jgi:DNA modification methylase
MTSKRRALAVLRKAELLEVARVFELDVAPRMTVDELVGVVAGSKRATLDQILGTLSRDTLKAICTELDLHSDGREKRVLVERIVDATGGERKIEGANGEGVAQAVPVMPEAKGGKGKATKTAKPQTWLAFPTLGPGPDGTAPAPTAPTGGPTPLRSLVGDDWSLTLEVERRKPRLAWQGMWRKELAAPVPTQVVEIVHPGRAIRKSDELGLEARQQAPRDGSMLPPNRLIWTNDNLVALATLLEERDPTSREYRYRGGVDFIYIDPPFMVNNDFRADNSIDVDLDEEAGVMAKKEPSLVEILAYKDTWRQGLDTFLSMLRRRLDLLKQLLSPRGTICVHLDWHVCHYVKIVMDEIFGYENMVNEIIWKRSTSHNDLSQGAQHLGRLHDNLLVYSSSTDPALSELYAPYDASYVRSHYNNRDSDGRRFQLQKATAPGGAAKGNAYYELMGHWKYWAYSRENMQKMVSDGRIVQPSPTAVPRLKRYLDESPGVPLQDLWTDIPPINSMAKESAGYPTQKPLALLERLITLCAPAGGLVLDCFVGSGTTCEAAERLGRRWIGIDNGKYAVHLARKRLIQLHGQQRPADKLEQDYVECEHCGNIERKERKPKEHLGPFHVQPFTVENMGVYQRAEKWQDFQTERSRYRDEMIKVFGGEPLAYSPLLHGKKGNQWVHIGPLDGPISVAHVWNIARDAQQTGTKAVTILAADFDTLSASQKDDIQRKTGVTVTIRIIPASAIEEIKKRIETQRLNPDVPYESMAIPAFYAPLSIRLASSVKGRRAQVKLDRCEVDIQSFLDSQRPVTLKKIVDGMTPAQKKKGLAVQEGWDARKAELDAWLAKATTWQKFIDFWAVDWDYGSRVGPDGKPIFETDWQSFRERRGKDIEPLTFTAELEYSQPGHYRVAARVTDVFGNDGIASVEIEVK